MTEFNQARFDRYIRASEMIEEAAELVADAETGYWGNWVPFRDAVRMLERARTSGALDLIASTGNCIIDAVEREREKHKKRPPRLRMGKSAIL